MSIVLPPTLSIGTFSASFYALLAMCPALLLYYYLNLGAARPSGSLSNDPTIMPDVRVSKILVHPLKSCRGISVQHSQYTPEGLEYDRRWCIIEAKDNTVITAREFPKASVDQASAHSGILSVSFPEGSGCETFSLPLRPNQTILGKWERIEKVLMWDVPFDAYVCEALPSPPSRSPSAILSSYFGRPVHLVYKGDQIRPCDPTATHPNLEATAVFQDCFPLMVLSEESTTRIEEELRGHVGTQGIDERWKTENLVIERFRPNIVFRGAGPFAEDSWSQIRIGSQQNPVINMVSKCTRCLLPNISPETGERDAAVPYKTLMKFRTGFDPQNQMKPCVGCNGVPSANGEIRVGDVVAAKG
ncbi:hypothetical protein B0H11DRAFT_2060107 [Mycena galericulata]|nr:hypothetical protein B0H11DRAFT_2060107 [Mycena galericulata]